MCVPTGKVITQLLFRQKFPLSKVRVITSGSVPPVLAPSCHRAFHVRSSRRFQLRALLTQGKAWHDTWASPMLWESKHSIVSSCQPLQNCHRDQAVLPVGVITANWSPSPAFPCHALRPLFPRSWAGLFPTAGWWGRIVGACCIPVPPEAGVCFVPFVHFRGLYALGIFPVLSWDL